MKSVIELVKVSISEMADAFYQGNTQVGYDRINIVITNLMELTQKVAVAISTGNLSDYDHFALIRILTDAMNALEVKDTVLLSDILQYDMLEELDNLESKLQ